MKVGLPIETKVRELDGKLWLALNLLENGHEVVIGDRLQIGIRYSKFNLDAYFATTAIFSDHIREQFKAMQKKGTWILLLHPEGAIFRSEEEFGENFSPERFEDIDYNLAWGNIPAEIARKHLPNTKVRITGNPRFDLLNEPLSEIYFEEAEKLKEEFGEYVLVNTNWPMANPTTSDMEIQNHFEEDEANHELSLLKKFAEAVEYMSNEMDDLNYIIRPHPSENQDTYRERFDANPNVHVKHSGDVRVWIAGSQAVIHNSCTTGVESALLNRPTLAYRPVKDERFEMFLPNLVSDQIETLEQLYQKLLDYVDGTRKFSLNREQEETVMEYFHSYNHRAVDEISALIDGLESRTDTQDANGSLMSLPKSLVNDVRYLRHHYHPNQKQRFPGLTRTELTEKINQFSDYVNTNEIRIESIEKNLYSLEKA